MLFYFSCCCYGNTRLVCPIQVGSSIVPTNSVVAATAHVTSSVVDITSAVAATGVLTTSIAAAMAKDTTSVVVLFQLLLLW